MRATATSGTVGVVVPTDDGVEIYKGMLGRAEMFFIYEIRGDGKVALTERRENPYSEMIQHLKTLDVYELIRDASLIVAANIGKKGVERLKKRGMRIFFRKGNIRDALTELLESGELGL